MSARPLRVTVVGAGVIGLSCAIRLQESGHVVTVVAERPPAHTTSAVAAALWYPYLAFPADRVGRWAARTYEALHAITTQDAADGRRTTVRMLPGRELLAAATQDPGWVAGVAGFRRLDAAERAGHPDGWGFTAPVVDMPSYLEWLLSRVLAAGGQFESRRVRELGEESRTCDVLVNCTGLGARDLVPDPSLRPVRGQVVVVANPGLGEWLLDETVAGTLTYVVPRTATMVCGGTAEVGAQSVRPDPVIAAAILARARAAVPALRDAAVLEHRVGLRPARPTVRLERETRADGVVVHCYGHGGAGVTLSWGCAEEVAALVGR